MTGDVYRAAGSVVERTEFPRCRLVFRREDDGSMTCNNPDWIDEPPMDASVIARIMREAGDALLESMGQ